MWSWIRRLWLCKVRKRHEFGPGHAILGRLVVRKRCRLCGAPQYRATVSPSLHYVTYYEAGRGR